MRKADPMTAIVDPINRFARKVPTWAVFILYLIPAPYLFYLAATGGLGVEPINALEREMGEITLQLLIIGLAITPLRKYLNLNLIKFRRTFGVLAFVYVCIHLLIWVVLDMDLRWAQMWADIWKRPYITIGMVAFLAMIPLAVTSNNASIRKMGASAWRKMHKLVYPIAVLGAVHFIMVQKVWETEPLVYLGVILGLLALRYKPSQKATGVTANS